MSLNDFNLNTARGVDQHPGVANATSSSNTSNPMASNFVEDPTTDNMGAGAGPRFDGHNQARRNFAQTAGVVEGRPGIIESTNIDPLHENSNKMDGWGHTQSGSTATTEKVEKAQGIASQAATMATGAGQFAYGTVVGDEKSKQAGRDAMFGQ
ncbi:hypothetical protein DL96DRAFT_1457368 [Flagelloscypha sp. PMI_526]|nr:hypothetical protein DL96DRAFT_1457368 [Flagelloscypha sp. PMI_526]